MYSLKTSPLKIACSDFLHPVLFTVVVLSKSNVDLPNLVLVTGVFRVQR